MLTAAVLHVSCVDVPAGVCFTYSSTCVHVAFAFRMWFSLPPIKLFSLISWLGSASSVIFMLPSPLLPQTDPAGRVGGIDVSANMDAGTNYCNNSRFLTLRK